MRLSPATGVKYVNPLVWSRIAGIAQRRFAVLFLGRLRAWTWGRDAAVSRAMVRRFPVRGTSSRATVEPTSWRTRADRLAIFPPATSIVWPGRASPNFGRRNALLSFGLCLYYSKRGIDVCTQHTDTRICKLIVMHLRESKKPLA